MYYIVLSNLINMSKKTTIFVTVALAVFTSLGISQQDQVRLAGAQVIDKSGLTNLPNFIKFNAEQQFKQANFIDWAVYAFNVPSSSTFKSYKTESDELGYTHTRYKQYVNGFPVEGSMVISHSREGKVTMVNGDYFQNFSSNLSASLSEQSALQSALKKVNAVKYMWENVEMQKLTGEIDACFTEIPKGELVFVHKKGGDYSAENMRLAYKFNIYAEVPLYRANVFVDANTGEILDEQNLICNANVVGSAVTKYSGTKVMTCDNASGPFRLRETGRGNGIQTYNMNNGTTYTNTDFTNTSSTWTGTGVDQAATDAHWGAEMTWDYFNQTHNWNSIDNAGFLLKSYVHYSTNYVNAFWDGQRMTYGDGDGTSYTEMTGLDVCGHEITHGLTSNTAGLIYQDESGALSESFSDIFGNSIENFARPTQWDWKVGEDISVGGSGLRSMSNPGLYSNPDTYSGTYWYTGTGDNGGVHTNSGVGNYWYYLLVTGGSGVNDISNSYSVNGMGWNSASRIAFRGLTNYFTSNTTYANARTFTIQSAIDIFGNCSPELAATTNAWYAVGVGAAYAGGVPTAGFNSTSNLSSCTAPLTVNFTNGSSGAVSYVWNFGDGGTSTTASPAHTYTAGGVYAVQLVATGTCSANSKDTILKTSFVTINGPPTAPNPSVTACGPQSYALNANGVGTITWSNSGGVVGTGSNYTTPTLTATTTYSVTSSIPVAGTATLIGAPTTTATLGAGSFLAISNNHWLIFDALAGFTLKSYDVYAQAGGSTLTVQLIDNAGTVLGTLSPTLVTGKNTLTLNWRVPVGTGYKLTASGTSTLFRNSAGAAYPIAVGTVASITANDVMGTAPTYYYWFYNWTYAPDVPCPSNATIVTATIQNCTGINNLSQNSFEVYPNPAHDNLFIKSPQNIKSIQVVDMIGKTLIVQEPNNERNVTLDVSVLPAGVYFVKVNTGDTQKLIRVIKQ